MRHFLILLFVRLAGPALAQTRIDAVRAYLDADDSAGLDEMLAEAHRRSVAGEIPLKDLREAYTAFQVSDPRTDAFVEAWVAARPQSPYALTARARLQIEDGRRIRGTRVSAHVLPESMARMHARLDAAQRDAETAYHLAPDFVSASDALFDLALTNPGIDAAGLLDAVMARIPSRDSLLLAGLGFAPKWGGSLTALQALCTAHAGQVPDAEGYTPEICLADQIFWSATRGQALDWAFEILTDSGNPVLAYGYTRIDYLDGRPDLRAYPYLLDRISEPGNRELELAELLNRFPSQLSYDARKRIGTVRDNAMAWARTELHYDPANRELIELVLRSEQERMHGLLPRPLVDGFWRPYLRRYPGDADAWAALADTRPDRVGLEMPAEAPLYLHNAVA